MSGQPYGEAEERQLAAEIAATKAAAVDRATALSQARTRVVEAAKAWREVVQRYEARPRNTANNWHYAQERYDLLAAVDALEEVERR